MRTLLAELARIHSHLVWLGTTGLELGAISIFWYCFRERDLILDLFEMVDRRPHAHALLPGRRARGGHPAGLRRASAASSSTSCRSASTSTSRCSRPASIFLERTKGVGLLSAEDAIALGQSGPMLRASGRRLGPAQGAAVPRLRPGRLRRPRLPRGRRLRPVQGAHGRDARVDAHRPPVPRGDARGPVDRRRPQDRPAAAQRAAHLDGEPDPPLQARHRGLPRPGGRGLRDDRVPARRARLLRRLRRRPEAVAREVPRAVLRRARGDGDLPQRLARSPT